MSTLTAMYPMFCFYYTTSKNGRALMAASHHPIILKRKTSRRSSLLVPAPLILKVAKKILMKPQRQSSNPSMPPRFRQALARFSKRLPGRPSRLTLQISGGLLAASMTFTKTTMASFLSRALSPT